VAGERKKRDSRRTFEVKDSSIQGEKRTEKNNIKFKRERVESGEWKEKIIADMNCGLKIKEEWGTGEREKGGRRPGLTAKEEKGLGEKRGEMGEGEMRRRIAWVKTERYIGTGPSFHAVTPTQTCKAYTQGPLWACRAKYIQNLHPSLFCNAELYSCAALPLKKKSPCVYVLAPRAVQQR
jgi:hypothetical protein